jgi:SPP1 family predicted phage head-tail adaptor
MAGLAAGSLDRRIRIERDGPATHNGLQNVPGAPSVLATVWAQYKPARGAERFELATREAEIPVAFVIRWSRTVADVGPADRVRYPATDDGQLFDIIAAPREIGRRDGLELTCRAVSAG